MAKAKEIAEKERSATTVTGTREIEPVLQPPVDICEDDQGITLIADMPGVSRERLNLQVDRDSLLIEGDAKIDTPENIKPLYADIRATRYRRSFALSSELDTDQIEANIKDGVLTLRIHKRPESRPRRIDIQVS